MRKDKKRWRQVRNDEQKVNEHVSGLGWQTLRLCALTRQWWNDGWGLGVHKCAMYGQRARWRDSMTTMHIRKITEFTEASLTLELLLLWMYICILHCIWWYIHAEMVLDYTVFYSISLTLSTWSKYWFSSDTGITMDSQPRCKTMQPSSFIQRHFSCFTSK